MPSGGEFDSSLRASSADSDEKERCKAKQDAEPLPARQSKAIAMENDHADQAYNDARDPPRVQLFLARHRHHNHREQRRRGVQDRGQPARDIGLPDHDQRERQHVVEKPDGDERPPLRQAGREADAVEPEQRQQHDRGERYT